MSSLSSSSSLCLLFPFFFLFYNCISNVKVNIPYSLHLIQVLSVTFIFHLHPTTCVMYSMQNWALILFKQILNVSENICIHERKYSEGGRKDERGCKADALIHYFSCLATLNTHLAIFWHMVLIYLSNYCLCIKFNSLVLYCILGQKIHHETSIKSLVSDKCMIFKHWPDIPKAPYPSLSLILSAAFFVHRRYWIRKGCTGFDCRNTNSEIQCCGLNTANQKRISSILSSWYEDVNELNSN